MKSIFKYLLFGSFFIFLNCERVGEEPIPVEEPIVEEPSPEPPTPDDPEPENPGSEDPDNEEPNAEEPDPEEPQLAFQNLLDENLSNWYKWLGVPHHSVKGLPQGTPTGDGMNGMPLGRNDPKNVFSVVDMDGEKVIKVTGEIYGALTTIEEYENYHLKLEYKWGTKKWEPRLDEPRDIGIMYHCTGKNEEGLWSVFMLGLENQIIEEFSGDLYLVPNIDFSIWPVGKARINNQGRWDPTADYKRVGGGPEEVRQIRSENFESPPGSWTTMEVYTIGQTAIHLVNGNVVMVVEETGLLQENGTVTPLKKGKIQLQSEGAEAYYKNVSIRSISEIPNEIKIKAGL